MRKNVAATAAAHETIASEIKTSVQNIYYSLSVCGTAQNTHRMFFDNTASSMLMGASAIPSMAYNRRLANKHHEPSSTKSDAHEESYMLLLELSSQEPTIQSCFKIIEATCLARGIQLKIRGRAASDTFQKFLDRYYLPFAESAIRQFFTLGFVAWRLRRLASGDCVPEALPLGMFTWSIDSMPNRTSRNSSGSRKGYAATQRKMISPWLDSTNKPGKKLGEEKEQVAARRAFENQKQYFASDQKPYTLASDQGSAPHRPSAQTNKDNRRTADNKEEEEEEGGEPSTRQKKRRTDATHSNTPAFYRQQDALRRQLVQRRPTDDEDTKMLRSLFDCSCVRAAFNELIPMFLGLCRYSITFSENCGVLEDDVEIYEFIQPNNSITRCSVLYGSVPSPLAHILVDYRNLRQAQMRQAYADAYNTQVMNLASIPQRCHSCTIKCPGVELAGTNLGINSPRTF